jgi:hypothetical protein
LLFFVEGAAIRRGAGIELAMGPDGGAVESRFGDAGSVPLLRSMDLRELASDAVREPLRLRKPVRSVFVMLPGRCISLERPSSFSWMVGAARSRLRRVLP